MKIYSDEMIKNKIKKQKQIKKVLKCLFYPIAVFIVICAVCIIYQKLVKKEDDVNLFGFRSYIILSGSMEPELQVGDMIVSKQAGAEQIQAGDIITFEDENGAVITHRVSDILINDGETFYQTKGDNNNAKDIGLVSVKEVKGKYAFKIGGAGRLAAKIMTPAGLLLIAFILTAGYIHANRKNDRKIARHLIRERYKKQNNQG